MITFWQDVRYALRTLRKSPGFAAVAVLTLALGIGATTAVFSVYDAILLRPLPVAEPDQLVVLNWYLGSAHVISSHDGFQLTDAATGRNLSGSFSYALFRAWSEQDSVFSSLFATYPLGRVNLRAENQSELAEALLVTGDYFTGLGVRPGAGRLLTAADAAPGATPVAVISHAYWQRRFGGAPDVVGKGVFINGQAFEIVGVTPPEFYGTVDFAGELDVIAPLAQLPQLIREDEDRFNDGAYWWLGVLGRLKPGVTREQAAAALAGAFNAEVDRLAGDRKLERRPELVVRSGRQGQAEFRRRNADTLLYSLGAVGLVLLIACANLTGLLLGRAGDRQQEIAVRLALGCGRLRLVRQLMTESMLLGVFGVAAGVAVAMWLKDALLAWLPVSSIPDTLQLPLDLRVLGFAAAAGMLTTLVAGLVPALHSTRVDVLPALREGAASVMGGRLRHRLGAGIVITQLALSLVVLVAGGLFLRTLHSVESVPVGFNPENILTFRLDGTLSGYEGTRLADAYDELTRRFQGIPGVRSVAHSRHGMLRGGMSSTYINVPGYVPPEGAPSVTYLHRVGGDFFRTLEVPVLLGRVITPQDNENSPLVAVVNEAFVRQFLGGQHALGFRFGFGSKAPPEVEIVGVVADTKYAHLRDDPPPTAFVSARQKLDSLRDVNFYLRASGDPGALAPAVRQMVRDFDASLPVFGLSTQIEVIRASADRERQSAYLSVAIAAVALALACVGLYGLMAQWVGRRMREMGIRMALGAGRASILGLVMRWALRLVAAGIIFGVAGAFAAARLIRSELFGVTPDDPLTYAAVCVILAAVALAACWVPARRATRVDPVVTLRYE